MSSCNSTALVTSCCWSKIECKSLWVSFCLVVCFSNQNLGKKKKTPKKKVEWGMVGWKSFVVTYRSELYTYRFICSRNIKYFQEAKRKVNWIVFSNDVVGVGAYFFFFKLYLSVFCFFCVPSHWLDCVGVLSNFIRCVCNNLNFLHFSTQQEVRRQQSP